MFQSIKSVLSHSFNYLITILVSAGFILATPGLAGAWTWVLHHQGQALNTNNNYQRINNGGPRLSTWQLNHNDPDQRMGFVGNGNHADGSFRFMIVQQSTGLCLNVLSPAPNQRVNTYACNRNDPEQQFKLNVLRDFGNSTMDVTVQVSNTNLCVDNYDRFNGSVVQVHYCNTQNENHVWRMDKVSEYIPTIGGGVPVTKPVVGTVPSPVPTIDSSNPPNLIRSGGGSYTGYILIDGIKYWYEQGQIVINNVKQPYDKIVSAINTLKAFEKTTYDKPHVLVNHPTLGEKTSYIAPWGFYVRLKGYQADKAADEINLYGSSYSALLGYTVGAYATPVAGFIAGGMSQFVVTKV
jgi:Ricin-type beta-trefoil lectin domain